MDSPSTDPVKEFKAPKLNSIPKETENPDVNLLKPSPEKGFINQKQKGLLLKPKAAS